MWASGGDRADSRKKSYNAYDVECRRGSGAAPKRHYMTPGDWWQAFARCTQGDRCRRRPNGSNKSLADKRRGGYDKRHDYFRDPE